MYCMRNEKTWGSPPNSLMKLLVIWVSSGLRKRPVSAFYRHELMVLITCLLRCLYLLKSPRRMTRPFVALLANYCAFSYTRLEACIVFRRLTKPSCYSSPSMNPSSPP